MNNGGTLGSNNNINNGDIDAMGLTYGIAFVIAILFTIFTIAFACVRLRMTRTPNILSILAGIPPSHHQAAGELSLVEDIMEQGLHHHDIDISFDSYPKLLYSEVEKNKDGRYSSCSICLGDYKETDILRLLPDCGHLYHLDCVDPWLRLHSTCPICRKSSLQTPRSTASNVGESVIPLV